MNDYLNAAKVESVSPEPKKEIRKSNAPILKEIGDKIKSGSNWLAIGILCVISLLTSLFNVGGDGLQIREFPTTAYGWLLWIVLTFTMPTVGVFQMTAFRKEGLRQGHTEPHVKEARDAYIHSMRKTEKSNAPQSQAQYLKKRLIKDSLFKFPTALAFTVATASVLITSDISGVVSTFLQLLLFFALGLFAQKGAYDYCCEELVLWYRLEANKANYEVTCEQPVSVNTTQILQESAAE